MKIHHDTRPVALRVDTHYPAIMTTLHLIHGYIGAGKTTYAIQLADQIGGFRITHDEWMARLYGIDPPQDSYADCFDRVSALAWDMAERILALEVDVILDFGFWSRADRDAGKETARGLGVDCLLHAVTCPEDVARDRIAARNAKLDGKSLFIAENTFETLKSRFEPIEPEEPYQAACDV